MKLKTLLLSSAAAFAVVGGAAAAQAADLSVAEPVDHVKVCDAFGAGYWYIPGTDTCLKIGGLVRFEAWFKSNQALDWGGSGTTVGAGHSASWQFRTEAHVTVTAKSMTEYGPLTGFLELRAQSDQTNASNNLAAYGSTALGNAGGTFAYADAFYLQLGMLTAGWLESVYHYSGGLNFDWGDFDAYDIYANQVSLTWAMSGFGIQLAIEDPRGGWGTNLSSSYSMPSIVGNMTWAQGKWSGQLSGGFSETSAGSGFGAQIGATVKLDQIAPGDKLILQASWAQSEVAFFGASHSAVAAGGSVWGAMAAFQHFWSPTLQSNITWQYMDESGVTGGSTANNYNAYSIAGNLVWSPVTNFLAGIEGGYEKYSNQTAGTWGVKIRMERDW